MIHEVCRIAEEAGQVVLAYYQRQISVVAKTDGSPLSAADRASHDSLVRNLERLTPGWPVVSEESSHPQEPACDLSQPYWLIDPLDGTKEFLKGTNEFTVNIGLIQGGRPILGVVLAPALSLTYYATPSLGAWRKQRTGPPVRIRTRPADRVRLAIVASKDHAGPLLTELQSRVPELDVRYMGSSLKFCLVAEGTADLYLRDLPTMEWDTAAAQCILEVSGGNVCSLLGEQLRYGKVGLKNPAIVAAGDTSLQWKDLLTTAPSVPVTRPFAAPTL